MSTAPAQAVWDSPFITWQVKKPKFLQEFKETQGECF